MKKFDEMLTQVPDAGPVQLQAQSLGGMAQSQSQGVRAHYET